MIDSLNQSINQSLHAGIHLEAQDIIAWWKGKKKKLSVPLNP